MSKNGRLAPAARRRFLLARDSHAHLLVVSLVCAAGCSSDKTKSPADALTTIEAGPSCQNKSGPTGDSTISVSEPGATDSGARSSILHVPASYASTKPTMLVLNLHGLLEPNTLQEQVSGMSAVSDQRGFIVAYPEGSNGAVGLSWNAGGCCVNTNDDVRFIRDLVTRVESDYCIDPKRVFVTGLSNGAMMSYRLACEASDVFAAAAPVAGASLVPDCAPARPVPILAIHGTADPIVHFNGGLDGLYHALLFPPLSYSIDLWRNIDACPNAPRVDDASTAVMPADSTFDGGPSPAIFAGSTLVSQKGDSQCHTWSGCKGGSEIELCTITDGGHAWPGNGVALPASIVGKTSTDLDASNTIIDFFERHPMP